MSQQVASLYAKIGADTAGFEAGSKRVKGELNTLAPGIENVRGKLTGFVSANAGLIGGLFAVGAAFGKAITDTMKYASEVRDLSLATGQGAEESSRLLQVLDDYQLTAGDVTAGMRAMKEKGIVPTVDSLASLSEQFLAIEDPAKRLQFAQDNLGRSSAKYLNVLSQGPDKIRQLNGAVSESLILTDEQIRKSEEARLAMDAWGDAVMGAKVEIATGMLPVLDAFDNSEKELALSLGLTGREADRFAMSILSMKNETNSATQSYSAWAQSLQGEVIPALEEVTASTEQVTAANQGMLGVIQSVESETQGYKETQASLREEMALLKEEYANGTISQEEYGAQVDIINGKVKANELAHIQAGKAIVFSMMQQKAAVDGLTDAEFAMLTDVGVQMGIFSQQSVDMAEKYAEAAGNIAERSGEIEKSLRPPISSITALNGKIEATAAKSGMNWDFFFHIHTTGSVPNIPGIYNPSSGSGGNIAPNQGFATGGYGLSELGLGEMASVGEMGEEGIVRTASGLFVIPANKWRKMKGGRGWGGKEYGGGGAISHGGPLTGEDLRNARIEQRERRRDEGGGSTGGGGGGVVISPSTGAVEEGAAATPMAAAMGLSGGPVGQSVAASAAAQAVSSAQSVKQLSQISLKLDSLIGKTASASDIASAMGDSRSMYS